MFQWTNHTYHEKIPAFISLHKTLCKQVFQMPKSSVYFAFVLWGFFLRKSVKKLIYAESISGAALIFTMCLNFVHTLQFNFKYGFRPAFLHALWQILLSFFFLLDTFKIEFLNIDILSMIFQLILVLRVENVLWW